MASNDRSWIYHVPCPALIFVLYMVIYKNIKLKIGSIHQILIHVWCFFIQICVVLLWFGLNYIKIPRCYLKRTTIHGMWCDPFSLVQKNDLPNADISAAKFISFLLLETKLFCRSTCFVYLKFYFSLWITFFSLSVNILCWCMFFYYTSFP